MPAVNKPPLSSNAWDSKALMSLARFNSISVYHDWVVPILFIPFLYPLGLIGPTLMHMEPAVRGHPIPLKKCLPSGRENMVFPHSVSVEGKSSMHFSQDQIPENCRNPCRQVGEMSGGQVRVAEWSIEDQIIDRHCKDLGKVLRVPDWGTYSVVVNEFYQGFNTAVYIISLQPSWGFIYFRHFDFVLCSYLWIFQLVEYFGRGTLLRVP